MFYIDWNTHVKTTSKGRSLVWMVHHPSLRYRQPLKALIADQILKTLYCGWLREQLVYKLILSFLYFL